MGALHDGHLSLIRRSVGENQFTAISVFVNPTQFNKKQDFENYPRNLDQDLEMIRGLSCDFVFVPQEGEMYSDKDPRTFDFGDLDKTMEGQFRPGHFNGVAQIVSKLLDIVRPERAYFGEKDFQQLVIIRSLVRLLNLQVEIIGCPIIRDADGLAMSSRNQLLSPAERKAASLVPETMRQVAEMAGKKMISEISELVKRTIHSDPGLTLEYFEIVNERNLEPLRNWSDAQQIRACIAVHCGAVRLIDNMNISY